MTLLKYNMAYYVKKSSWVETRQLDVFKGTGGDNYSRDTEYI